MYGAPALKVRGHMFACMASHKSAEPNTLVVRIGFDRRDELIAADPGTYYLKDHYENYPSVLVRLSRIPPHALRELLLEAWRFTTSTHDDINPRSRVRGPGLQDVAGRVPSRGDAFGVRYSHKSKARRRPQNPGQRKRALGN